MIASLVNQVLGASSRKALAKKLRPEPEMAEEAAEDETEVGDDEMAELEAALNSQRQTTKSNSFAPEEEERRKKAR